MIDDTNRTPEEETEFEPSEEETDEVSLEELEEHSALKIKDLREKLKRCEEEKRSIHEDLQRTRAEYLNARRRHEEQKQLDMARVSVRHIEELLPLCDSFDMAMRDPQWENADPKWRAGVEGIYNQLMNILKSNEVTVIDPLGEVFDPQEHEALRGEGDTVTEVYQRGYRMKDTLVRPAKVSVEESN